MIRQEYSLILMEQRRLAEGQGRHRKLCQLKALHLVILLIPVRGEEIQFRKKVKPHHVKGLSSYYVTCDQFR